MQVQIVFNRASGRYSAARVRAVEAAFAAAGAAVSAIDATPGLPDLARTADRIVVLGGDGTARHVAHALAAIDDPPPLSVFPGGTVNLLAREWAGTRDAAAFAARVCGEAERPRYPVEWSDGSFLSCAGCGWESVAVARVDPALKRAIGRTAYAVAALRRLIRWRPPTIVLDADGRTIACQGFHIAKGVHFAGPWRLAERPMAHERTMQVVVLTRARRRDLIRFWIALARGEAVSRLPFVETIECRSLAARSAEPLPVQADGDLIGVLPMSFRVAARAIRTC